MLEVRLLLTSDFGDAPDTSAGSGVNDYQTLAVNGGPSHVIDATRNTLFLGGGVDGEAGTQQSLSAYHDNLFTTGGRNDEDGVLSSLDLTATVGSIPTITLSATNTTSAAATLSGWIDINRNGVFDNATERAQITVPAGTTAGRFTLTFPKLAGEISGSTYARFRLSSDPAAANSTGAANGGEVEDYRFQTINPVKTPLEVSGSVRVANGLNGGPASLKEEYLGSGGNASIGDLDGNGVGDLAVGALGYGSNSGAVYILFRNADGTVSSSTRIASAENGGPVLAEEDFFGGSISALGDIDGDGIVDLAVGAPGSDSSRGAVYFVHLNANGTAKSVAKLSSGINGVPTLAAEDLFAQVTSLGDLNGDGTIDIAVGASGADGAGTNRGAIYVLLLNSDGTVKSSSRIDNSITWNPNVQDDDVFGETLVAVGDVDGDGIVDLATTSRIPFNVSGNLNNEIIDLLFLNTDGTTKRVTRLGTVADPVFPRSSVVQNISAVGDINGDGIPDLSVTGFDQTDIRNPVLMAWFLTLNANGTAGSLIQLPPMDSGTFGFMSDRRFVASMGDANGDGTLDVAVGMPFYNGFPNSTPSITVLSLATRAPKIPGVPILTGNPASTTSPRPSISWLESSHADSYEIWLSTFNTGEVVARSVPVYGTSWAPPTDLGIGRYAAWVRATNSVGKSAWSLRYDFTVTTATTMNATPDGINRRPPLTWQPLAGAAKYEITASRA